MMLGAVLGGFRVMVRGVQMMAVRDMRMVMAQIVIAFLVSVGRFVMMLGGGLVMFGGLLMVFGERSLGHGQVSFSAKIWRWTSLALGVTHA
jgi:hypothetical protein